MEHMYVVEGWWDGRWPRLVSEERSTVGRDGTVTCSRSNVGLSSSASAVASPPKEG